MTKTQPESQRPTSLLRVPPETQVRTIDPARASFSTDCSGLTHQIEQQLLGVYDFEYLSDDESDYEYDDSAELNSQGDGATVCTMGTESTTGSTAILFSCLKESMRRHSKPRCARLREKRRQSFVKPPTVADSVNQVAAQLEGTDLEGPNPKGKIFEREDIERRECRRRASKTADLAMLRSNSERVLGQGRNGKRVSFSVVEMRRYEGTPVSKRPSLLKKKQLSFVGWRDAAEVAAADSEVATIDEVVGEDTQKEKSRGKELRD